MAISNRFTTVLALALCVGLAWAATPAAAAPAKAKPVAAAKAKAKAKAKAPVPAKPAPPTPSESVAQVADWIAASGDNRGLPYAIVDKVEALVFVYGADGELKGAAPALIGSALGDHSTPGVGDRELSDMAPEERTTPAGRFMAAFGPAPGGKRVLWVDYSTAISLHPVINTVRKEQRPKRLASATPEDNRITFGCINVSAAFHQNVVRPAFKAKGGVFYILPEIQSLQAAFPAFEAQPRALARQVDPSGSAPSSQSSLAPR